ncbi:MAG TPA: hypothetical protein ENK98_09545, partial [Epsilonproteobacteria bacterium]|nr:hypothetical protein [Campylobacterota bacterium]
MSDIFKMIVIRPPELLSQKKMDSIAHFTHTENIQSERFKKWSELGNTQNKKELHASMKSFIEQKNTWKDINEFPKPFMQLLQYADYHAYDFSLEEFSHYATKENLIKIFGEGFLSGKISTKSLYLDIKTKLEDILLAQMTLGKKTPQNYNVSNALLTLELCKKILVTFDRKDPQVNVKKHYKKPLVVDARTIFFDPCQVIDSDSVPIESHSDSATKQRNITDDDCECLCEQECIEQSTCCDHEIIPYLAELYVVKDEVRGYEPGEISYIENIMKDEIRVRKHRHLQREELYTEQEEEVNTFEEKEFQTDEQFSVHKEVDKVIEKELSLDAGASYKYGGEKGYSATVSFDASSNTAKKDARKLVQDKSKQVIEKAISRVEKKVRSLATRKLINETEEKNKHVFGGETGAVGDMSRQFYYVNQVRKAQVYSYGVRQIIDLTLPEPATLFKRLLEIPFEGINPG